MWLFISWTGYWYYQSRYLLCFVLCTVYCKFTYTVYCKFTYTVQISCILQHDLYSVQPLRHQLRNITKENGKDIFTVMLISYLISLIIQTQQGSTWYWTVGVGISYPGGQHFWSYPASSCPKVQRHHLQNGLKWKKKKLCNSIRKSTKKKIDTRVCNYNHTSTL